MNKKPVTRCIQSGQTEEEYLITDHDRVYTKVKKTIKQMLKLDHQEQMVALEIMISGIMLSRKARQKCKA